MLFLLDKLARTKPNANEIMFCGRNINFICIMFLKLNKFYIGTNKVKMGSNKIYITKIL